MASSFFRLYRELSTQTYDTLPNDYEYNREREELFHSLGHNVGRAFPTQIKGPQHHGKIVRRNRDENIKSKWGPTENPQIKMEKKRVTRAISDHGELVSKITREMSYLMDNNQQVSKKLMKQLFSQDEAGQKALVKATVVSPSKNIKGFLTPVKLPPIERGTLTQPQPVRQQVNSENKHVIVAQPNKILRTSELKWSIEERARLTSLYQSIPLPTNRRNFELWKLYFINFSNRYIVFYPNRTHEEVTIKLQEMISNRQFKETGEVLYWKNNMPSSVGRSAK